MTLTTLTGLPRELILEIALQSSLDTQFCLYITCNYIHNCLAQLKPNFIDNHIDLLEDQNMKFFLINSAWMIFYESGSISLIDPQDLILRFLKRPISSRFRTLSIGEKFDFNELEKTLIGNQFHSLDISIFTNDPLNWSILGEANTEYLVINCYRNIINGTNTDYRFESFAMKSPVVHITLNYYLASLFFEFAHLFKNLESISLDYNSDCSNLNLIEFRKRCPNLKSIVAADLYDKIVEMDWQMEVMEVYSDNIVSPLAKNCKKLSIHFAEYPDYPFVCDFLQDNKKLEELAIYFDDHWLDLLPFNLNLIRFSICTRDYGRGDDLPYKFLETQHNLEILYIFLDDDYFFSTFEDKVVKLIRSVKNLVKLKSIEISSFASFPKRRVLLKKFMKELSKFKGRALRINGFQIDTILRDIVLEDISDSEKKESVYASEIE